MPRWLLKPWAVALAAGLLVLAVAFAPAVWRLLVDRQVPPPDAATGLPWQVQLTADGHTRIFGIEPGRSRLGDLPVPMDDLVVGLVAAPGHTGSLEAYVERFQAGWVAGRLVVAAEAAQAERQAWQAGARREGGAGGALRYVLVGEARRQALAAPVRGLTFIPSVDLGPETLVDRFGAPPEVVRPGGRLEHWLYPGLGLAITVDAEGREVMQYVAPPDFDARLRAPLRGVGAAASAAASR